VFGKQNILSGKQTQLILKTKKIESKIWAKSNKLHFHRLIFPTFIKVGVF